MEEDNQNSTGMFRGTPCSLKRIRYVNHEKQNHSKYLRHPLKGVKQNINENELKGTVRIISSYSDFKDCNTRFTTVPLKDLINYKLNTK